MADSLRRVRLPSDGRVLQAVIVIEMHVPAGNEIVKAEQNYGAAQHVAKGLRPAGVLGKGRQVIAHWYSQISGAGLARQAVARGHALPRSSGNGVKPPLSRELHLFRKEVMFVASSGKEGRLRANLTYFSYSGIPQAKLVAGAVKRPLPEARVDLFGLAARRFTVLGPAALLSGGDSFCERPRSGGLRRAWLRDHRLSICRLSIHR